MKKIFVPHKKAKINGEDIINFLKDKYTFDKNGSAIITKDSNSIRLAVMQGSILIVVWDNDKNDMKYFE